jgi:hypothetical protein
LERKLILHDAKLNFETSENEAYALLRAQLVRLEAVAAIEAKGLRIVTQL